MDKRPTKRRGRWIVATVVVTPVLYVLSLGPAYAVWLRIHRNAKMGDSISLVQYALGLYFEPIQSISDYLPEWARVAIWRYMTLWY